MAATRNWILAAAFVATCIASVMDLPGSEPVTSEPAQTRPVVASAPVKPASAPAALPARAHYKSQPSTLFAAHSWQPAPPPPQQAPAPKAPPLPFRYLGKALDGSEITVFVEQGALTHLLHRGEVVGSYRVETITPAEMSFVYLPLNEKQRLIFGSAN